jgi:hypothetical protein
MAEPVTIDSIEEFRRLYGDGPASAYVKSEIARESPLVERLRLAQSSWAEYASQFTEKQNCRCTLDLSAFDRPRRCRRA